MKVLITKLLIAIALASLVSCFGASPGADVLSTLLTAYSVVFSVFVSFAVSFNLREVRNSTVRNSILKPISSMTQWAIIDFVYTTIFYALCPAKPMRVLWLDISTFLQVLILINMISVAFAFWTLRKLRTKLEEVLQKEDEERQL